MNVNKQQIENRLKSHTPQGKADVITAKEFSEFYGVSAIVAARKLKAAEVEMVGSKYFIPSIVDKIYQNIF